MGCSFYLTGIDCSFLLRNANTRVIMVVGNDISYLSGKIHGDISDHSALLYGVCFVSSLSTAVLLHRQPAPAGPSQNTSRLQVHNKRDTMWLVCMFRILERLIK